MRKYLIYYILLFTLVTGFYSVYSYLQLSGSQFIYPIDDAYIHLAIAKNFGEAGFWSINTNSFDSASSSILYTIILSSLIKIFGLNVYYPMMINILAGYVTVYWIYRYFRDFYTEKELKLGLLLFLPVSLLYMMVILGMEQTLHMMLSVMAIYFIKKNFVSNFQRSDFIKLITTILFLGMIRFESMFFVFCLGILLMIDRRFKESVLVLAAGFLPIVIFGLISIQAGGFFFPNSVIIKGSYPEGNLLMSIWMIFQKGILLNISFYKLFLFPMVCIFVYVIDRYKNRSFKDFIENEKLVLLVFGTVILQSLFAVIKFRYENYLMIMLILILVPLATPYLRFKTKNISHYLFAVSFAGFCLVGFYRLAASHPVIKVSSKNIEKQQVEMGRFLHQFYKGQKAVANDIGAIAYFGETQLLDIVGLGSTDVAKFYIENKGLNEIGFNKKYHQFLSDYISKNQYKIAVIYPKWFPNKVPKNWIPVASWKIENNRGTAQNRVVWYSFNKKDAEVLKRNLGQFNLNKNITQYYYINK
ncbi:hypothetical protein LUD75_04380 [Epilithonimonas sp. JDS]|uniref:hypothetical protein n=1 Tax=Epilithonimonas sp. JDS TaxID=2902797 RepID=UPI001E5C2D29|nr:hypothetical protein [Epilithonimonas sp. JDS]MCD9853926.1 hypothetical protein [Epilithonimonas sp. JDS]